MEYIKFIGVFILLVLCTIEDFKYKKITNWHLLIVLPFFSFDLCLNSSILLTSRLIGVFIGCGFLLLSKITKEQVGVGDAYIITAIGLVLGGLKCFEVITYSFLLSSVVAIMLMAIFKVSKKRTIPFVPFLLGGFLCSVVLGGTAG